MPICSYCKKEFAEISLGKGGHDWLACSEDTVERFRSALKKIESGYYDQFGEPKKIAQEALRS